MPGQKVNLAGTTLVLGGAGFLGGHVLAASSVTLLGSKALGTVALALGLISPALWPAILLGAVGAGAGATISWKLRR
jgi:hypothetical protein